MPVRYNGEASTLLGGLFVWYTMARRTHCQLATVSYGGVMYGEAVVPYGGAVALCVVYV